MLQRDEAKQKVVLDTCVLVSVDLTDLLLTLAEAKVFEPIWSDAIENELARALRRIYPYWSVNQELERIASMNEAFSTSRFALNLIESHNFHLPDSNDDHVVNLGISANAAAIITFNLKDFPPEILHPFGIEVFHPDEFLDGILTSNYELVVTAIEEMVAKRINPQVFKHQLLEVLERDVPMFVRNLRLS